MGKQVFVGFGELVKMLGSRIQEAASGHAVLVVVILVTGGKWIRGVEEIAHISSGTRPVHRLKHGRDAIATGIVVIDHEGRASGRRVSNDRLGQLSAIATEVR